MSYDLFDKVEDWVFDLDNTLYPASSRLFDLISLRMTAFIAEYFDIAPDAARARQKEFYMRYGTTMRGLMVEHGVDPAPFLDYVHQIDLGVIPADPALSDRLARLPGRKLIFTNASRIHAERVMERIGIAHHFETIFDIASADYVPKPSLAGYETGGRDCLHDRRSRHQSGTRQGARHEDGLAERRDSLGQTPGRQYHSPLYRSCRRRSGRMARRRAAKAAGG
jgi:putative hydrolase of the HAD superfamily